VAPFRLLGSIFEELAVDVELPSPSQKSLRSSLFGEVASANLKEQVTARNRDIVDGRIDLRMGRRSEQWEAFSDLRLRDMGEKGG
jgi:hypothetical protein